MLSAFPTDVKLCKWCLLTSKFLFNFLGFMAAPWSAWACLWNWLPRSGSLSPGPFISMPIRFHHTVGVFWTGLTRRRVVFDPLTLLFYKMTWRQLCGPVPDPSPLNCLVPERAQALFSSRVTVRLEGSVGKLFDSSEWVGWTAFTLIFYANKFSGSK